MSDKFFLDTNILVYAFIENGEKCQKVKRLLDESPESFAISTQVLNEFYNALSKHKVEHKQIVSAVNEITTFCEVDSVTLQTVTKAYTIKERYGFSYWDCLILSAALENGCNQIFSEDMHDGQIIEGTLKIVNIFKNI